MAELRIPDMNIEKIYYQLKEKEQTLLRYLPIQS